MSRRSSTSVMGPPAERDVVMGPPPLPAPVTQQGDQQKSKDPQDISEKYKKLKRRYFELEEKHREMTTELQRSGERNVKMRGERDILLDRIMELEAQPSKVQNGSTGLAAMHSNAFPKSLLNARARNFFTTNLRQAMTADEPEGNIDPLLTSRHVGPAARKRAEDEKKERQEDEARELRRSSRSRKPQNPYTGSVAHVVSSHKGKETARLPAQQPLLTYAPVLSHGEQSPVLVSTKGTRLRIKPPQPPQDSHASESSASHDPMALPSPSSQHHQAYGYPPPSSQQPRSQSPVSPIMSPHDETRRQASYSHRHYRNGAPRSTSNHSSGSPSRHEANSSHPSKSPNLHQTQHQHQIQYQSPHSQQPSTPGSNNSRGSDVQRHAKPKRLKAHTVTSRSFSIPMVPRDKKGRPMLPLNVGIMTVISLGEVCMREHFHTERYIFPVGYEVTRRYLSTMDPMNEVVYTCTILDGGDGPKFRIVPSDASERTVIAGTATGAWSSIVKQANGIRNRQHSNSVSGPDFFGLGQNTIKHLIQELVNADRLRDYVWQNFVEGGPLGGRHAAVIPALPEDYQEQGTLAIHHPSQEGTENHRRASISDKEEPHSPQLHHTHTTSQQLQQQPVQPGLTTIVLPPPTPDTLNIQEYQPPVKDAERRVTRGRAAPRGGSQSESPTPGGLQRSPRMRTRNSSRNEAAVDSYTGFTPTAPPSESANRSPYLVTQPSPPPVPPTFASIMNAYPAPGSSSGSRPGSGNGAVHANGNGSASNAGSEQAE